MTASDIELWLATWMFPYWRWIVVPRCYQVVGHECDLLALTEAGYAHEVEIKISLGDVKADQNKDHGHVSNRIKCFWFAMPEKIVERAERFVPKRAGILALREEGREERIKIHRKPQVNREALPWPYPDRLRLARAGYFRYWRDRYSRPIEAAAIAEAEAKEGQPGVKE